MTYLKQIDTIIKEEVDKKVKNVLEKFIPVICRRYPETFIETQLWTELKQVDELFKTMKKPKKFEKKKTPICKGVTNGGNPCSRAVRTGEYCCNHQDQKTNTCIISGPSTPSIIPQHNHNVFKIKYQEDCPACIAKKNISLHIKDPPSPSGSS